MSNLEILPVRKLKELKTKKSKKIHPHLPQPPCLCCLSAGVNQGKSTFLCNIVFRFYRNYYDQVFWISPSVHNDKTCWAVREDETITMISEDLENLDQILLAIKEKQMEDEETDGKMTDVIIILDDCVGYLRKKGVSSLFTRFRHFKLSFWIAVQDFRALPVAARYNCQYWFIWRLNSKKELGKIVEEMEQSFPDFLKYYEEGTKKRYDFIYCDMKNLTIRHNFGKILYSRDAQDDTPTKETPPEKS